jgi:hypothetical protein
MGEILYKDDPDWRSANWWEWESATWSNVQVMCEQNLYPEKRLLIGHWHSWRLRYFFELGGMPKELPKHLDCSSYNYENKLIAIDGCSNLAEGVVNTFVYETNEEPQLIDAKIGL